MTPVDRKTTRFGSIPSNLLVASPYVNGSPYERSVVLVLNHSERGACGVVLDHSFQESLKRIRETFLAGPARLERCNMLPLRLAIRFMAWGPGQLERELESGVWMPTAASFERVFTAHGDLWVDLVRNIGRSVLRDALGIEQFPSDPTVN